MSLVDKIELENHHIAEEMVEHLILEKVGALPDHGHAKAIKLKKKVKKSQKNYLFEFFMISFIIIGGELWYLWNFLIEKYPSLQNLF
jgi:hypothetical protein